MTILDLPFPVRLDDCGVRDDLDVLPVFFADEFGQHGADEGFHSTTRRRVSISSRMSVM